MPAATAQSGIQRQAAPIEIVAWEVGVDLRNVSWSEQAMRKALAGYKLRHAQCVLLFNNSRMFGGSGSQPPKCRMYLNWHGQVLTLIPQVRRTNVQATYQLDLNRWLAKNFGADASLELDTVFGTYHEHYTARRKRQIAALRAKRLRQQRLKLVP